MARTRLTILFEAEAEYFLSESFEGRGGIAVATLTSSEGLAAKKDQLMTGRVL